jgi:thioredoxin-like negative regulator of GroEL
LPVIEALAEEFAGRVRFVKVDVDPESDLLEAFDSKGVPTYLVFRQGVEVDRLAPLLVDWRTEQRLRSRIEDALAATPTAVPGS